MGGLGAILVSSYTFPRPWSDRLRPSFNPPFAAPKSFSASLHFISLSFSPLYAALSSFLRWRSCRSTMFTLSPVCFRCRFWFIFASNGFPQLYTQNRPKTAKNAPQDAPSRNKRPGRGGSFPTGLPCTLARPRSYRWGLSFMFFVSFCFHTSISLNLSPLNSSELKSSVDPPQPSCWCRGDR